MDQTPQQPPAADAIAVADRPWPWTAWLALLLIAVSFAASIVAINHLNPWQCFVDEGCHAAQMYMFLEGKFAIFHLNATFPTYHAVVSAIAKTVGATTVPGLRVISMLMGLLVLPFSWLIGRALHPSHAVSRALQFVFLPILFPFFFLLYTDTFALVFVLASLAAALRKRPCLAALAAIAAVGVRQNMVVWLAFGFCLLYVQSFGWTLTRQNVLAHLRRAWLFVLGAIAFVAFVIAHGGVAMGDQQHHPGSWLHLDNFFFILVVIAVIWLPLHVANAPAIAALLRRRPWVWLVLLAGLATLMLSFSGGNDYNDVPGFLRNDLIGVMTRSRWTLAAFFPLMAWVALSLAVTPLERSGFVLIFLFGFLALFPEELIEQRYSIPALALLTLVRKPGGAAMEWAMGLFSFTLAGFFTCGIALRWFFL